MFNDYITGFGEFVIDYLSNYLDYYDNLRSGYGTNEIYLGYSCTGSSGKIIGYLAFEWCVYSFYIC